MSSFSPTCSYKLIYIFRINDDLHQGMLKIGDASLRTSKPIQELPPNCHDLNQAAKKRIATYTATAGIHYELLHTELAVRMVHSYAAPFRDYDVHEVLLASGVRKHSFDSSKKANEWFATDLETAKKAIQAFKDGESSLSPQSVTKDLNPIIFRPEQREAIDKTIKQFKKHKKMLWNAKMRFGKTLCALEVVKQLCYQRTIIFTHRPVVLDGWYDDFKKIFYACPEYRFGSKTAGLNLDSLVRTASHYVYFASIQDLRGSAAIGGRFDKNDTVFSIPWDCVIIDEAHEGTKTELGENVISAVVKENTRVLHLSGTPFNLRDDFRENEIFTWDYVMEQSAKLNWEKEHPGDPNPYAVLPKLNIFTYDLDRFIPGFQSVEDTAFNFREFFRTWQGDVEKDGRYMPIGASIGSFVHENAVRRFLNMLCDNSASTNYPYSTQEYRDNFRHSLWMLPGVKEARALSDMLREHPVFGSGAFSIVNVAGDGDEEKFDSDALKAVRKAISDKPDEAYSITLSCGRLTTGVSVKEWTAVFMLSGSATTSASNYLQTIFRVQTPGCIGARQKTDCYVFDFAPDRTLSMVAEAARISSGVGHTTEYDREIMAEFLNFCPVISLDGSSMVPYDVGRMLKQLKKAYVERVVRSGFDDNRLYNNKLEWLDKTDLSRFEKLRKIIGSTKQSQKIEKIDINVQGFTKEEYEQAKKDERKPKKELTPEQRARQEKLKEIRKNREKAISILRGISIRIPLLIYGAELKEDEHITLHNLTSKIDDVSWAEFMPAGIDKVLFRSFIKFYDPDIFEAAGVRIREVTEAADQLPIESRIKRIAEIFSHFRNPDKETVLTPWRVVNMQLSDCLGGYDFFDETHTNVLDSPRFVNRGTVTVETVANPNARILELNAKTGLYSLYVAYSLYKSRISRYRHKDRDLECQIWQQVLRENVFIICKTKMSRHIACRTLAGFTGAHVNVHCFDDLLNQITSKIPQFIKRASRPSTYGSNNPNKLMKFNAIVGNPPYQVMDGGNKSSAVPIYHEFVRIGKKLTPQHLSLIMPARWYSGGRNLDDFRAEMLKDRHICKLVDFEDSTECFDGVDIAGGLCYFLRSEEYSGDCEFVRVSQGATSTSWRNLSSHETFMRNEKAVSIIEKISAQSEKYFSSIVSSQRPFGLRTYVKPMETGDLTLRYNGGKGPFKSEKVTNGKEWVDKWKVITSYLTYDHAGRANNEGKKRILSTTEILRPGEICTETYLVVGTADSEEEIINMYNYIKTKFVRFLIGQIATTQHLSKQSFSWVPSLDFTKPWTDLELYIKYGLSPDEVAYIESSIKEM